MSLIEFGLVAAPRIRERPYLSLPANTRRRDIALTACSSATSTEAVPRVPPKLPLFPRHWTGSPNITARID